MAKKLLTMAELRRATYGSFTQSGVRVDLDRYFETRAGRQAIKEIRTANNGRFSQRKASAKAAK